MINKVYSSDRFSTCVGRSKELFYEIKQAEMLINKVEKGLSSVGGRTDWKECTAKTQYRKFETNIPRKGTARLQSQFLHSCFCERSIYLFPWSVYIFCFRKIGGLNVGT